MSQGQTSQDRQPIHDRQSIAESYRSQAEQCERLAQQELSADRKNELNVMADSLRVLAENEEWLAGATRTAGNL